MKIIKHVTSAFAIVAVALFSIAAPAHADAETSISGRLSSQTPAVGDPVAVQFYIADCVTFPTTFQAKFYHENEFTPYATLTSNSPGFSKVKLGTNWSGHWIFKGINSAGIDNIPVMVSISGAGGCATGVDNFYTWQSWTPLSSGLAPPPLDYIFLKPLNNAMRVEWSPISAQSDTSFFYELQFRRFGTTTWSGSEYTRSSYFVFQGLQKYNFYEFRLRTGNRFGTSVWTSDSNHEMYFRTPGLFDLSVVDSAGLHQSNFTAESTKKIKIHLDHCNHTPNSNDAIDYYFGIDAGTYWDINSIGGFGTIQLENAAFDGLAQTIDAEITLPTLARGNYRAWSLYRGQACTWPLNAGNEIVRNFNSNIVDFAVDNAAPTIAKWGSNAGTTGYDLGISKITATSARVSWASPRNQGDGPFTYSVTLTQDDETVRTLPVTKENYVDLTGLIPGGQVSVVVAVSNPYTQSVNDRPTATAYFNTPDLTVKRGISYTPATFAKAVNTKVPSGATLSFEVPKASQNANFKDCIVSKTSLKTSKVMGACTVLLVIQPKKVGRVAPAPNKLYFNVMLK